jgi:hypothetical protein
MVPADHPKPSTRHFRLGLWTRHPMGRMQRRILLHHTQPAREVPTVRWQAQRASGAETTSWPDLKMAGSQVARV